MPCAAPCNRMPCNQRCSKSLTCGHRCPGVCGEVCAENYCHVCSKKLDARVDFLEMKSYGEIDIDETPIVVLGCGGQFFTAESLDGILGLSEVYEIYGYGEFIGLKDVSGALAQTIPCCPDCKCPVRQFVTQRYNRSINRAVIDKMSKRFLTTGREELRGLEQRIVDLERNFEKSREDIMKPIRQARTHVTSSLTQAKVLEVSRIPRERNSELKQLENAILQKSPIDINQHKNSMTLQSTQQERPLRLRQLSTFS